MSLISQERLLEKLDHCQADQFFNIASIRNFIREEPEAEKHGRWELKKYKLSKGDEIAYYQCSCCNHATWTIDGWMYCPYCGAKMEEDNG